MSSLLSPTSSGPSNNSSSNGNPRNSLLNSGQSGKIAYYGTAESSCSTSTGSESSSSSSAPNDAFINPHNNSQNNNKNKKGSLSTLQLATIIFYSVSGGPFGVEEAVRAAGPFYTLIGFLLGPLLFSVPECLMTVELSAGGFQSSAACCAWVEEAFGTTAGFLAGFLSWVSGATDNAIYPILFLSYSLQLFPSQELEDIHSVWRFAFVTCISLGLAYMNWLGLDLVGNMSIGVCCIAMSPFLIFVVLGASQVDPQRWFRVPADFDAQQMAQNVTTYQLGIIGDGDDDDMDMEGGFFPNVVLGGVMLRPLLNNLFWQYSSFDNAGSFAEDIQNPARVMPRAMLYGFVMVVLGYIIPLLVALGTTDASPEEWVDGYLAQVVTDTIGPWLGKWLVFAAALSNLGLFQAELSADAYMLMGMAERGHLPKFLSWRSSNGTPTYALLVGTLVIVVMGVSNLDDLIEMLNFNYALALLLEYAAFIKLRISKPEVARPFRVPLSTTGCAIALVPSVGTLLLVIALASYTTICVNMAIIVSGTLIYALGQWKDASASPKGYEALFLERNREYTPICGD